MKSIFLMVLLAACCIPLPAQTVKTQMQRDRVTSQGVRYRSLFRGEGATEWKNVQVAGFSLKLPYSVRWKISDVGISVFDVETNEGAETVISFGKPVDAGTYITREYRILRFPARKLNDLKNDIPPAVDQNKKPQLLTVEGRQCLRYYEGGAKGSSLVVACNIGTFTYVVYKTADMGGTLPELDNEMKIIIKGIR